MKERQPHSNTQEATLILSDSRRGAKPQLRKRKYERKVGAGAAVRRGRGRRRLMRKTYHVIRQLHTDYPYYVGPKTLKPKERLAPDFRRLTGRLGRVRHTLHCLAWGLGRQIASFIEREPINSAPQGDLVFLHRPMASSIWDSGVHHERMDNR